MKFLEKIPLFGEFFALLESDRFDMMKETLTKFFDVVFAEENRQNRYTDVCNFLYRICDINDKVNPTLKVPTQIAKEFIVTSYRGYYEKVIEIDRGNSELDSALSKEYYDAVDFFDKNQDNGNRNFNYLVAHADKNRFKKIFLDFIETCNDRNLGRLSSGSWSKYSKENANGERTDVINSNRSDKAFFIKQVASDIIKQRLMESPKKFETPTNPKEISGNTMLSGFKKFKGGMCAASIIPEGSNTPEFICVAPYTAGFQYADDKNPNTPKDRTLGFEYAVISDMSGETVIQMPRKHVKDGKVKYAVCNTAIKDYLSSGELGTEIGPDSNLVKAMECRTNRDSGDITKNIF